MTYWDSLEAAIHCFLLAIRVRANSGGLGKGEVGGGEVGGKSEEGESGWS